MQCPICGSDDIEILNSKKKESKKKFMEEYLLKCFDCGHVFKDVVSAKKPKDYRLIISEQNKSHKTTIELSPSDELKVGDILLSDLGQVEVSSIEVNDTRVKKALVEDIETIWATSIEIPARIGFSVDLHGEVDSYKLDLERDFEIAPGDVVKIEKVVKKDFQVEETFLKVTFLHPQELAKNRDKLRDLESVMQIREFDIPFYRRYLMDRDVIPMTKVKASGEKLDSFSALDSEKHDVEIIKLDKALQRVDENFNDFRIIILFVEECIKKFVFCLY